MKKMNIFIVALSFLIFANPVPAQADTVSLDTAFTENTGYAKFAVPSALITYGIITRLSPQLQKIDHHIDTEINAHIHRKYKFDNYIQYAPHIAVFGLDMCNIPTKHSFVEQTLITGTSLLIMTTCVTTTKALTNIERPDKSDDHSFPSGHTATSFLGAHILFREYKHISPWIGYAGYTVASVTGGMRMINRKHWFSDVITGAGIGIISAELSYLMLPAWQKLLENKSHQCRLAIAPIATESYCGIGGMYVF
jgi:membrane-associated phospholipid phosphatase